MLAPKQNSATSMGDITALRLLRACPREHTMMHLGCTQRQQLTEFRRKLEVSARRPLKLSRMNTPMITTDERSLLNAIAYAQLGEETCVKQALEWLAHKWSLTHLLGETIKIAAMLESNGVFLNVHHHRAPIRREEPALYCAIG
jgi:hypothetical protein